MFPKASNTPREFSYHEVAQENGKTKAGLSGTGTAGQASATDSTHAMNFLYKRPEGETHPVSGLGEGECWRSQQGT